MTIGAIILAAGYASRMNACKPLLPFGSSNAVCRCVDLFSTSGIDEILVVTGYRARELEQALVSSHCRTIRNPDFDSGMFSSVCAGVQALAAPCDAFFLLPVDIPLVRPATVGLLREQFDGSAVLFPLFEGERGHPPLIPCLYREAILRYSGTGGLRPLLEQLPGKDVPVWDSAVLQDMDIPRQYQELCRLYDRYTVGTRSEARALARHFMPENSIGHGQAVAEIACLLGKALNRKGYQLDMDILYNAGLLHDIAKGQKQHARAGADLLVDLGLSGLAEPVLHHNECLVPEDERLSEKELVCLADKLVSGCRRVTITERFAKTFRRYGHDPEVYRIIKGRQDNTLKLKELIERQSCQSLEEILDQKKRP
ncbi:MAG: phosphohydrolase [Proteobacteria bacterium]|nr:MAG: phosphohydrolase [Pseudomonadota bacterium]PIE64885.1 MAG: phosphohydrolase [Desulfobacterales bacterium]